MQAVSANDSDYVVSAAVRLVVSYHSPTNTHKFLFCVYFTLILVFCLHRSMDLLRYFSESFDPSRCSPPCDNCQARGAGRVPMQVDITLPAAAVCATLMRWSGDNLTEGMLASALVGSASGLGHAVARNAAGYPCWDVKGRYEGNPVAGVPPGLDPATSAAITSLSNAAGGGGANTNSSSGSGAYSYPPHYYPSVRSLTGKALTKGDAQRIITHCVTSAGLLAIHASEVAAGGNAGMPTQLAYYARLTKAGQELALRWPGLAMATFNQRSSNNNSASNSSGNRTPEEAVASITGVHVPSPYADGRGYRLGRVIMPYPWTVKRGKGKAAAKGKGKKGASSSSAAAVGGGGYGGGDDIEIVGDDDEEEEDVDPGFTRRAGTGGAAASASAAGGGGSAGQKRKRASTSASGAVAAGAATFLSGIKAITSVGYTAGRMAGLQPTAAAATGGFGGFASDAGVSGMEIEIDGDEEEGSRDSSGAPLQQPQQQAKRQRSAFEEDDSSNDGFVSDKLAVDAGLPPHRLSPALADQLEKDIRSAVSAHVERLAAVAKASAAAGTIEKYADLGNTLQTLILQRIVRQVPTDKDALKAIDGVGKGRLKKLEWPVLGTIRRFLRANAGLPDCAAILRQAGLSVDAAGDQYESPDPSLAAVPASHDNTLNFYSTSNSSANSSANNTFTAAGAGAGAGGIGSGGTASACFSSFFRPSGGGSSNGNSNRSVGLYSGTAAAADTAPALLQPVPASPAAAVTTVPSSAFDGNDACDGFGGFGAEEWAEF